MYKLIIPIIALLMVFASDPAHATSCADKLNGSGDYFDCLDRRGP